MTVLCWRRRVAIVTMVVARIDRLRQHQRWRRAPVRRRITGVVKDTSGGVLPGVTVEVASPALIEQTRTAVTNERGKFRSSSCGLAPTP